MASLDFNNIGEPPKVDTSDPNYVYFGYAKPGTQDTDSTWAIVRINVQAGAIFEFPNKDKGAKFQYSQRAAYTYGR